MFRIKGISGLLSAMTVTAAAAAGACGDVPTSPGSPAPQTSYVLSGVVVEATANGPAPLAGAVVRHIEGPGSATTDSTGFYSMAGVPAGRATVVAAKDGYTTATRVATLTADTRIDLELARLPAPNPLPTPFIVSGLVYERTAAGHVPIDGVSVEDSTTHIGSRTDASGRYRFSVSPGDFPWHDGVVRLYVTKEGFHTAEAAGSLVSDLQIDIELVRR